MVLVRYVFKSFPHKFIKTNTHVSGRDYYFKSRCLYVLLFWQYKYC